MLPKWLHTEEILMKPNVCVFFIENNELLEKQNEIWDKVSNAIKKGFDSESVYSEKYLKTKIKSFKGRTNINFRNDKI